MYHEHEPSALDIQAFKTGVRNSGESGILNSLFTVRTNQLFNLLDKTRNAFYLSGLLIGSELNDLLNNQAALCFYVVPKTYLVFTNLHWKN